jgi:PEGA domain
MPNEISFRRWVLVPVLIVALLMPGASRAADEEGQVDSATEDLIQQGISLRRAGKDEAALAVFLKAEKRAPTSVRILLHVTTAAQGSGRWVMAHDYLRKASLYRTDPYYQRYRNAIRTVEDTVAQHVGQFRTVGTPPGAEVLLNGQRVGSLPMDEAVVVEVGSYVLEVSKPGYFPFRRPISVAGGGGLAQESVGLSAMGAAVESLGTRREPTIEQVPGVSTSSSEDEASPLRARWVTWALAGSGLALLGTSGVLFAIREQKVAKWNDDNACLSAQMPLQTRESICGGVRRDATSAERFGLVAGVLGIGLGGAALAHWLITSPHPMTGREHASYTPSCGVGPASIACHGTF